MQKIVIVANGAAYGSESLFNSLRLAIALREKESDLALRLFLMSDAVTAGLKGQRPAGGYNIQQMLEILTAQNVPVKLCKTCTDGRGVTGLPLIDGVEIGTLVELAEWTLTADTFGRSVHAIQEMPAPQPKHQDQTLAAVIATRPEEAA
jgi:uncharacterized protein involved in oxidation of intracellular sulfur